MRRFSLMVAVSLAACSSSKPVGSTTAGTAAASSSGTTSAGATTGAITGTTTTATGTGTGVGTGTTSASGSSSAGATSGGPACASNAIWSGDKCLLTTCAVPSSLGGACQTADGGVGTCVGGVCNGADVLNDTQNCGTYGAVCPAGLLCVEGYCSGNDAGLYVTCDAGACPTGTSCDPRYNSCGSDNCANAQLGDLCEAPGNNSGVCCSATTCSDLGSDPANCGGCGNACPGSAGCYQGRCLADCATAPASSECTENGQFGFCCQGTCEITANDPANCGSCGAICPSGSTCTGSYCSSECQNDPSECPAGTLCNFALGTCDPTSCAGVSDGNSCGLSLANGQPVGGKCCGGSCVYTTTDSQHCGACGTACGANLICLNGVCQPAVDCATATEGDFCTLSNGVSGVCCNEVCTDLASDPMNCGACFTACSPGAHCAGATQAFTDNCAAPDGGHASCQVSGCPPGYGCYTGYDTCYPTDCAGHPDRTQCMTADGGVYVQCCDQQCSDLSADPLNCGQCGLACPQGSTCVNRSCTVSCESGAGTCPAGTVCAGGECVPRGCTDLENGAPCAFASNSPGTCCNGTCTLTDYEDSANCSACGVQCGAGSLCTQGNCLSSLPSTNCDPACGAGQVCAAGVCVGSLCLASSAGCAAKDGAVGSCCGSGTCADLLTDASNCGRCSFKCQAGAACQAGVCLGSQCSAAQSDDFCGSDANHICCGTSCADVSSDPQNCGFCGQPCAQGQTCQAGVCIP